MCSCWHIQSRSVILMHMCTHLHLLHLATGTCCWEVQRPKHRLLNSDLCLLLLVTDPGLICPSSGAVLFSLRGRVLSRQQPVTRVMRVLHLCSTLGAAAAEHGAQACAERLSEQYKHDAVGCSLSRVANTLWRATVIDYYTLRINCS